MKYRYHESSTGGQLVLTASEADLNHHPFRGDSDNLLTIAWNNGPAQYVYVDEVAYELFEGGAILLIHEHTFHFDRPQDIVAWQFNRDFYCIIDHDAEVSCTGLIFYGLPSPMRLVLDDFHQEKVKLLYQVFLDEYAYQDNIQGEMLRMLLKRLIIILTRLARQQHLQNQPPKEEVDLIRKFNVLVEQHFRSKHQVADYAELMFKSPKTISNVFGKHSGHSPLQVIRDRIALEAKRRLLYTNESISEIGYYLGYDESAHFSRFFKKMEGLSPSQFRAQHL